MQWIKLIPFLLLSLPGFCQDTVGTKRVYKQEIGIDLSNTIFLIRKEENMYLLNYKYHFKNHAIRSGINLKMESEGSGEKSINYRLGIERTQTIKKWQLFYGVDLAYSYKKYNFQGNYISQYIVAPLIGFRYFLSPRFSISTEPKLLCKYVVSRDPESFNKDANHEDYSVALGSIGVVLVNFHF